MAWREWMRREFAEESDGMAKGASSVRDGAIKVTSPFGVSWSSMARARSTSFQGASPQFAEIAQFVKN